MSKKSRLRAQLRALGRVAHDERDLERAFGRMYDGLEPPGSRGPA